MVGEFGGHGLAVPGHLWNSHRDNIGGSSEGQGNNNGGINGNAVSWGYGKLPATTAEFKERYRISIAALRELQDEGIGGGIYTQTTDVEGEVNGLLTYDRKVSKIDPSELKAWHVALFNLEPPPPAVQKKLRQRF